ncbi:hypothetical protein HMPREF1979_02447 [Actinomyces johnsonii F0542]|uniref:Uncharacterized protein n=1 Tax=Actinomyces johnsonii F0542 TaxID=1321818 RepID=U1RVV4_9ACTO|nr:hypothetical protein HMPREF1979_02447 [Actinomyces johnsonii F0542]
MAGGLSVHVCLLDGSPEGPAATCGAPGRWSRLPSPVLTGAGSRVCGLPHSQRRRRRPIGQSRPGRRRGAPLSLQVDCSSTPPADTNSVRPAREIVAHCPRVRRVGRRFVPSTPRTRDLRYDRAPSNWCASGVTPSTQVRQPYVS